MKNKIIRIHYYEDLVVFTRNNGVDREYEPSPNTVQCMWDVLQNMYEIGLMKPYRNVILGLRFDILETPVFKSDLDELGCHSEGTLVEDRLTDNYD